MKAIIGLAILSASLLMSSLANAGKRDDVAVIVGNGDYGRALPSVRYAYRDAEAMKRFLVDLRGFDPENIIVIKDGSKFELEKVFGNENSHKGLIWRNIDPRGRSRVFVYYSGHGVPGQTDRRGYLLPVGANPDDAEINGYSIDTLLGNLGQLEIRSATVLLDACFSGESPSGTLLKSASGIRVEPLSPRLPAKVTVMTAARGDQLASWDDRAKHGLFTEHFLRGAYGEADEDGDNVVSVAEMRAYLNYRMTKAARRTYGRDQTVDVQGNARLMLARFDSDQRPSRPRLIGKPLERRHAIAAPSKRPLRKPIRVQKPPRWEVADEEGAFVALDDVAVRTKPSSSSRVLARLNVDALIRINGKVIGRKWYRTTYNGRYAYVFTRSLKRVSLRKYRAWRKAVGVDTIEAYKAYLSNYRKSYFHGKARQRIAQLVAENERRMAPLRLFEEILRSQLASGIAPPPPAPLFQNPARQYPPRQYRVRQYPPRYYGPPRYPSRLKKRHERRRSRPVY